MENILGRVTPDKMWDLATQFREVEILFVDFKTRTNWNISDSNSKAELLEEVDVRFKCCHDLYENAMRDGFGGDPDVENAEAELNAKDSTPELQLIKMTQCSSKLSTSARNLQRKIELERQRAEISATRKRDLAKTKAAADAAEAKAKADAEAADAKARFRFEEARL